MHYRVLNEWNKLRIKVLALQMKYAQTQISDELALMLIIGEDHRFFSHFGVDVRALVRSGWRIFQGLSIEGGSTIAMQLVRVLTGNYQKTFSRKLTEILFAVAITKLIGRKDLPKLYLMVAYYGWRMNGLQQAAKRLNFSIESANSDDAAAVVARLKYPEPFNASQDKVLKINGRINHILLNRIRYKEMAINKWKHLKYPMS